MAKERDFIDYVNLGLQAQQSARLEEIRLQNQQSLDRYADIQDQLRAKQSREELENTLREILYHEKKRLDAGEKEYADYPHCIYILSKGILNSLSGIDTPAFSQISDKQFLDSVLEHARKMQSDAISKLGDAKNILDKFLEYTNTNTLSDLNAYIELTEFNLSPVVKEIREIEQQISPQNTFFTGSFAPLLIFPLLIIGVIFILSLVLLIKLGGIIAIVILVVVAASGLEMKRSKNKRLLQNKRDTLMESLPKEQQDKIHTTQDYNIAQIKKYEKKLGIHSLEEARKMIDEVEIFIKQTKDKFPGVYEGSFLIPKELWTMRTVDITL